MSTDALLRRVDVNDGINVVIGKTHAALFPKESAEQVDFLIEQVNRAALAAAQAAAPEWQAIETAPKDGNDILVSNLSGFTQVVFWDDAAATVTHHWQTSDGPTFHDDLFTHWQPLPVPPK